MRVIVILVILISLPFGLLAQNEPTLDIVPNPFVDTTSFVITLPASDTVSLVVYNQLGELIDSTIKEQLIPQGTQTLIFIGDTLPLGQYIVYLDVDTHVILRKFVKVDQLPLNVENKQLRELHLNIFPNPTSGYITLTNLPQKTSNIAIYNVLGVPMHVCEWKGLDNVVVDLTELPKGLYYLHVFQDATTVKKKIVKL